MYVVIIKPLNTRYTHNSITLVITIEFVPQIRFYYLGPLGILQILEWSNFGPLWEGPEIPGFPGGKLGSPGDGGHLTDFVAN